MRTSLTVVLHLGSRGPDVERVQQALRARGFFRGEVNGLYGRDTEEAVQNFQRQTGLRIDGTVGPEVRAALLRDEELERAAQAAIHATVQATSVPGGVGVGGANADTSAAPPVEAAPPAAVGQLQTEPAPEPIPSPASTALWLVGGLLLGGILLVAATTPKAAFGDFEDDNGLPPMVPGLDEGEDDEDDVAEVADDDEGEGATVPPTLEAEPAKTGG